MIAAVHTDASDAAGQVVSTLSTEHEIASLELISVEFEALNVKPQAPHFV